MVNAMSKLSFDTLFAGTEQNIEYWIEGTIVGFTEELSRAMAEGDVSRSELARRIGASPAYITKVLRGNANLTLASMVKLSRALDQVLLLELAPANRTGKPIEPRTTLGRAHTVERASASFEVGGMSPHVPGCSEKEPAHHSKPGRASGPATPSRGPGRKQS